MFITKLSCRLQCKYQYVLITTINIRIIISFTKRQNIKSLAISINFQRKQIK